MKPRTFSSLSGSATSFLAAAYWNSIEALEAMQKRIQDRNVKFSYDGSRTMEHALVGREILRKQVQTVTAILAVAIVNSRYSSEDFKQVAALDVSAVRVELFSVKKASQQVVIQIQDRNWDIDVP